MGNDLPRNGAAIPNLNQATFCVAKERRWAFPHASAVLWLSCIRKDDASLSLATARETIRFLSDGLTRGI